MDCSSRRNRVQLNQTTRRISFTLVLTILAAISAVALTSIAYTVQVTSLENQLNTLRQPRIINISLGYVDNQRGVVHVEGYVYNIGNVTAYACSVNVKLSRNGQNLNSTHLYFGENPIQSPEFGGYSVPGDTQFYVNQNVTYSGNPPTNVTLTLGWIAPWQIPVP